MAELARVRAQLLDADTNEVIKDVDVLTSPGAVLCGEGKTLTDVLSEMKTTPGAKGDKGDTGAQGIQGVKGETGSQGIQGEAGLPGAQGIQGVQGNAGIQGVAGAKGDKGDKGEPGDKIKIGTDIATAREAILFFKEV